MLNIIWRSNSSMFKFLITNYIERSSTTGYSCDFTGIITANYFLIENQQKLSIYTENTQLKMMFNEV